MSKFITGHRVFGYDTVDITDSRLTESKEADELVVVISNDNNSPLKNYYAAVLNILKNRGRVVLIGVKDSNNDLFKPLAALMASYRAYDIYVVVNKDVVTAPYLKTIESREPDFNEVQTYVGGDIAVYSEISTLMIGIDNIVQEGNIERLSGFLGQHMKSIESLTSVLDYMKSVCESHNSAKLADKIETLEKLVEKHKSESNKLNGQVKILAEEKAEINSEVENLKAEVRKLRDSNEALKAASESDNKIITSFIPCRTTECECKVNNIIYFKEVSYVPYVNSLVSNLFEIYKRNNKKVKLLIYDNKTDLYETYKPLNIVSGKTFVSNRDTYVKTTEKFVVSEPAPNIIKEIIGSDTAPDILIIYDRMKTVQDIVEGNNVTKFFVINSGSEYNKLVKILKIFDESKIITRSDAEFAKTALDIPSVKNYSSWSESKKIVTYMRLSTAITKVPLIEEISTKSRIQIKGGQK